MRRRKGRMGPKIGHLPVGVRARVGPPRPVDVHALPDHVADGLRDGSRDRPLLRLDLPAVVPRPVVLDRELEVSEPPLPFLRLAGRAVWRTAPRPLGSPRLPGVGPQILISLRRSTWTGCRRRWMICRDCATRQEPEYRTRGFGRRPST